MVSKSPGGPSGYKMGNFKRDAMALKGKGYMELSQKSVNLTLDEWECIRKLVEQAAKRRSSRKYPDGTHLSETSWQAWLSLIKKIDAHIELTKLEKS